MTVRVLLVDDQPLIRTGFRMILEETPTIEVVGEADNGHAALRKTSALKPDVVLMDIRRPQMDGLEATRLLTARKSPSRVLVLTTYDLDEYAYAALRPVPAASSSRTPPSTSLSARSTPSPTATPSSHHASPGSCLTRTPIACPTCPAAHATLHSLTPREREVLREIARGLTNREIARGLTNREIARGLTNREIAATLSISEVTVKSDVGAILAKLDLRNRVAAVILAYELGLAD